MCVCYQRPSRSGFGSFVCCVFFWWLSAAGSDALLVALRVSGQAELLVLVCLWLGGCYQSWGWVYWTLGDFFCTSLRRHFLGGEFLGLGCLKEDSGAIWVSAPFSPPAAQLPAADEISLFPKVPSQSPPGSREMGSEGGWSRARRLGLLGGRAEPCGCIPAGEGTRMPASKGFGSRVSAGGAAGSEGHGAFRCLVLEARCGFI